MNTIIYLLQVTACTAVFYLFYFLFLSRLTFFTTNRWYLLVTVLFSFIIPLLRIPVSEQQPYVVAVQHMIYVPQTSELNVQPVIQPAPIAAVPVHWDVILKIGYFMMAAALSIHLLVTLLTFFKRIKGKRIAKIGKVNILSGQQKVANGSFLNYIFLNDEELTADELQQIIAHEMLHIQLYHSIDRILIKIAQIVLWFNPFIYLYNRSVEENHEFEVDREIARSTDKHNYANLLLHLSVAGQGMLYHNFSKVPLKKRISMLFNKPSNKMKKITYVLIVPVVLISCLAFARLKKDEHKTAHHTALQPENKHLPANATDSIIYRQKISQRIKSQQQTLQYKIQQAALEQYQQTDDYKNKMKLAHDIAGKTINVTIKGTIPNKIYPGKQGVGAVLAVYNGHEYAIDSRYGQEKSLMNMVKPGDQIAVKVFSSGVRSDYPVMIIPAYIIKNKVKIFQLLEADKIPDYPFLYEANKVRFAEGQVSNIVKYSNGKWKSALFETVNGYKFNLSFKASAPDFSSIGEGDHVRLRFVHEVKTGAKTYRISDWVSITTNIKDYGIKNPEFFYKYYTVAQLNVTKQDTTPYSNIPTLNKVGKNPLVLIDGKQYPADVLYKISRNSISSTSVTSGDEAIKKYGDKAKDGCIIIKTKNGQIENITSTEKENLITEKSVSPSRFYSRIALKSASGEAYDEIIVRMGGSVATTTIPHNAKTCLFIDNNFYDETDIGKISPEIISSLSGSGGVKVLRNNPDPKLKAYSAVFRFKTKINTDPMFQKHTAIRPDTKSTGMTFATEDSTVYDQKHQIRYLYGNAQVTYDDIEVNADFIRIDDKNQQLFASGRINPVTKKYTGSPTATKMGKQNQRVASDSLLFHYKTKEVHLWNGLNEQDFIMGKMNFPDTHFGIVIAKLVSQPNGAFKNQFRNVVIAN